MSGAWANLWLIALAATSPAPELLSTTDSRVWLEGSSSFRPYTAEASELQAQLELPWDAEAGSADALEALICLGSAPGWSLQVTVKSFRSGVAVQDEHLMKALRADLHPLIRFSGRKYWATPAATGTGCILRLRGPLAIAGVTHSVEVLAELRHVGTQLRLVGRKELRMTDYGVQPPVLMFGAIKTDDLVVVKFDLGMASM